MAEGKINRHLDWEEVPIEDIQPYKNNPKAHTLEQIAFVAKLIETYGWTQPICLDKDYEVVFGHCRLESAKSLGEATVPCVFREDLSEAEIKALRIADNKSNESEWIEERLEIELVELQAMDVDLRDVGFRPAEAQDPRELWEGMPEFEQENAIFRTIAVHFQTSNDVDNFAKLIEQQITDKTKYIWFPYTEKLKLKNFVCVDDET